MFLASNPSYSFQYSSLLAEKNILTLSKQRIIQKNLVHFQGFPDSIYDKDLLVTPEYFGQYGKITKIVLVSKEDKFLKKKLNSAYITFETKEQAAYCILSVDSIKIKNYLVRAFFGTTKYCNHFLHNYHCYNEEKCMFLHHLAEASDIINENIKFGYDDHIKLAKKIIEFGSYQSKFYVMNNYFKKDSVLPNIKSLYQKEDLNAVLNKVKNLKNNNHRRLCSISSNNSSTNNSINTNNRTISKSSSNNEITINDSSSSEVVKQQNKNCNEKKSRFFNDKSNSCNQYNNNIRNVVNGLFKRNFFFNRFKEYKQLPSIKELELKYCLKLSEKTNDKELKLLLENRY